MALGAKGNPNEPKDCYIEKDKVLGALALVGMQPIGDGTGFTEYEFMDWDYKGKVSFKAYCKWVKKAQVGEAYRS